MEQRHRAFRPLHRELSIVPDVQGTFERISRLPYPILFDSATPTSHVARYSFVAADPRTIVRSKGNQIEEINCSSGTIVRSVGRALDRVAELLYKRQGAAYARARLPPFQGGAAGYIGYEYGGVLERLPKPQDDLAIPDLVIGLYDWTIAWDHVAERCWVFADSQATLDTVIKMIDGVTPTSFDAVKMKRRKERTREVTSTFTRDEYILAVERVREYIRAGDIFQANLSQRFTAPLHATPWALYQTLRAINPAPFATYFDAGDVVIASTSPERFLHLDIGGFAETRPIKGTRPRSTDPIRDIELRDELLNSAKDAAEHVMIVDVLRNDLARVSEYGTVRVPVLMRHERHATVHHLVSIITSQLRLESTAVDLLHAAFPGGSITGAPKIRAMEIIAELEPTTRGVYCGAIGYFSITGAMDMSIAIRTCVVRNNRVYFSAGGGIVADSDPAAEYEETLTKVSALMRAISVANTAATSNRCP